MDVVSFMEIEKDEKDLIISFALEDGGGDIKSLILHRTLFYEYLMPDEESGTNVNLEGDYLEDEHLNRLESINVVVTRRFISTGLCCHCEEPATKQSLTTRL
jgi:hypothetical protein